MQKLKLLFLNILIFSLPGCFNYKSTQLKNFPSINIADGFYQIQDDIALFAKALSVNESKAHFGVDLSSHGYIPIQIRIENRSPDTYIIRPSYLDLVLVDPNKIAKLLHWDTSMFVMTAGCLSLLFWWPATIWVGQAGYDMYKTNKSTNEILQESSIKENQPIEIPPYDILNKFIFVQKSDFTSRFRIKMFNKEQKKLVIFDVSIFGYIKEDKNK